MLEISIEVKLAGLRDKLKREKEGSIKAGPQISYRDDWVAGGTSMVGAYILMKNMGSVLDDKDELL